MWRGESSGFVPTAAIQLQLYKSFCGIRLVKVSNKHGASVLANILLGNVRNLQGKIAFESWKPLLISSPVDACFDFPAFKHPNRHCVQRFYVAAKTDQSSIGTSPCHYVAANWVDRRKQRSNTCRAEPELNYTLRMSVTSLVNKSPTVSFKLKFHPFTSCSNWNFKEYRRDCLKTQTTFLSIQHRA